jgi:three-Cys-motif partner protein
MVLERAIADEALSKLLVPMFNDADPENVASLQSCLDSLPGKEWLKNAPLILCSEVGKDAESMFTRARNCPTFSFIDPFGYKGLSRGIIQSVIKNWGAIAYFSSITAGSTQASTTIQCATIWMHCSDQSASPACALR